MATPLNIQLETEPAEVRPGMPAALVVAVRDEKGAPVHDLQISHERAMHLLAISEDLAEFAHVHPEEVAPGTFRVGHTFPQAGRYHVFVDLVGPDGEPQTGRFTVDVAGEKPGPTELLDDRATPKTVGDTVVHAEIPPLRAGEGVLLRFAVSDAATGEAPADLAPYLGAAAHFVILSQDGQDFVHAHAIENGGQHGHGSHHGAHGAGQIEPGVVQAHSVFPRAGLYRIWMQFARGSRVLTAPFTVRVS